MKKQSCVVQPKEILDAREHRAERQLSMLACNGDCVISFTLNIPGPVKLNSLIRKSFTKGLEKIERKLKKNHIDVIQKEQRVEETGCEALFSVACDDVLKIKGMMVVIEENHPLGRLYDIDVISKEGVPVSRIMLGYPVRRCLLCDRMAHECARSQRHDYKLLIRKTEAIMKEYFSSRRVVLEKSKQYICPAGYYDCAI